MAEFEFTNESFPEEVHTERDTFFKQPYIQTTAINANGLYLSSKRSLHNGVNNVGLVRLGYIENEITPKRLDCMYDVLDVTTYRYPGQDSFIINPFRDFLETYLVYEKCKYIIDGLPEIYYRRTMTFQDNRIIGIFFAGVFSLKQLGRPRHYWL